MTEPTPSTEAGREHVQHNTVAGPRRDYFTKQVLAIEAEARGSLDDGPADHTISDGEPSGHAGTPGATGRDPRPVGASGSPSLDDGLSEAWRAAEAALPEGWWLHDLGAWSFGDMAYRAEAASPGRQTDTSHSASAKRHGTRHWVTGPSAVAYGPTPAAALLSLAEKLRDR